MLPECFPRLKNKRKAQLTMGALPMIHLMTERATWEVRSLLFVPGMAKDSQRASLDGQ